MLYAIWRAIQSGNLRRGGVPYYTIEKRDVKPLSICSGEDIAIRELSVAELPSGARRSPLKHSISHFYRKSSLQVAFTQWSV